MRAWLRQWRRRQQATSAHPRFYYRPSLEALEDRYLLSANFVQTNLVSDVPGLARVVDPYLVNPWGISFGPTGAFWMGENGTGVSDLLDGNGGQLPLIVSIPGGGGGSGSVTGTVFNGGSGFQISENGVSGPARFLFATEDGVLSAWNPKVDNTHALLTIDNSSQGASYKGLALGTDAGGQTLLYVANFGRGTVDVFDSSFHQLASGSSFRDPSLPDGYAPFNVANINGRIFVSYAQKEAGGIDDVAGAGHGFIDIYTPDGSLVERFASGGALNSPWAMTLAPSDFGAFGGALLVGNDGDGHISAYDPTSGAFLGQLTDAANNPIAIEHLWGLTFGNDHLAGSSHALFFTAGIDQEEHGLFGAIQPGSAVPGTIAGALPYDPSADDDGYPLPPATGPLVQDGNGSASPTSVLLPLTGSTLALAPTLAVTPAAASPSSLPGSSSLAAELQGPAVAMLASLLPGGNPLGNTSPTTPLSAGTITELTTALPAGLGVTGLPASGTANPSLTFVAFAGSVASSDETGSAEVSAAAPALDSSSHDHSQGPTMLEVARVDQKPAASPDALPAPEATGRGRFLPSQELHQQPVHLPESSAEMILASPLPLSARAEAPSLSTLSRWTPLAGSVLMLVGALGWRRFPRYSKQVLTFLVAKISRRAGVLNGDDGDWLPCS